jgi:hypothetical protein
MYFIPQKPVPKQEKSLHYKNRWEVESGDLSQFKLPL